MMPTVSVVMPVFNGERYLALAVESILNQSFQAFEFIIVDDGSTDSSPAILDAYARRDERIRVHHQLNAGIVAALNTGIALSSADWIARMDADDIALAPRLETQLQAVAQRPHCVALGSRVLLIDPDGRPIAPFSMLTSHEEIDAAHLANCGGAAICHPSVLLHRETVLRVGGYRQEMAAAEDLDLFLRLAEVGRIENLPDCLLHYRLHPASIGHARRAEQIRKIGLAIAQAHVRREIAYTPSSTTGRHEESPGAAYRRWSWWAIEAGNIPTARHNAWRALMAAPGAIDNWRVLYCALRGH
jgi:glycosyltransferase involved in cell wall biosynthesis